MRKNIFLMMILSNSCNSQNINFDYVQIIPNEIERKFKFSDYHQHYELRTDDLKEAEQLLFTALKTYRSEYSIALTPGSLKHFKRQYVAYINHKAERIIWINGFCRVLDVPVETASDEFELKPFNWKENIVEVDDGGDCYWQVKMNMHTLNYLLRVNGI